jgi:hypothetical protein
MRNVNDSDAELDTMLRQAQEMARAALAENNRRGERIVAALGADKGPEADEQAEIGAGNGAYAFEVGVEESRNDEWMLLLHADLSTKFVLTAQLARIANTLEAMHAHTLSEARRRAR